MPTDRWSTTDSSSEWISNLLIPGTLPSRRSVPNCRCGFCNGICFDTTCQLCYEVHSRFISNVENGYNTGTFEVNSIDEAPFIQPSFNTQEITPPRCHRCGSEQSRLRIVVPAPMPLNAKIDLPSEVRKTITDMGCPEATDMIKFLKETKVKLDSISFYDMLFKECTDEYVRATWKEFKESGKIPVGYQ